MVYYKTNIVEYKTQLEKVEQCYHIVIRKGGAGNMARTGIWPPICSVAMFCE